MNDESNGERANRPSVGWLWPARARNDEARVILDSMGDGVYQTDQDGRIVYANPACESLLGWSAEEELLGLHAHELFHRVRAESAMVKRSECPIHGTEAPELYRTTNETFWRRDGTPFAVDCTATALNRDGAIVGRVCVFADITSAKEALRELEAHAEQQAAVADLGRRETAEGESQELFDDAVRMVARVLGVELAKVLEHRHESGDLLLRSGVGWDEGLVGAATVSEGCDSQAGYTLLSNEPVVVEDLRTETRFTGPPLLFNHGVASGISAIIDGDEGPFGVLGAHTRRPRRFQPYEVDFLQSVANVLSAAIIRDRAAKLQVVIERGRRLEALGELAGGVAHDFNNLLSVIRNYADFAEEDREDAAAHERDLGEIRHAAERGAELTSQLLQFSKQERADAERVEIGEIIDDVSQMLRRTLGEHLILVSEVTDRPLPVEINSGELHRSIVNLALNGRDAMPGGGELLIRGERLELKGPRPNGNGVIPAGRYVRVALSDTGSGMSEAIRRKAFDPFFSTKGDQGTGLGLPTVYAVAARAGGHVSLTSREGEGTTVALYLPEAVEG